MNIKIQILLLAGMIVSLPTSILAQSAGAYEVASCNASFLGTCVSTDTSVSFSGTAAPIGELGAHPLEVLIAVGLVFLAIRFRRKSA